MSSDPPTARVVRRFDTAPERVFDAWLDVRLVRQWFGPGLGPVTYVDIDPSVNGEFFIVQQREGGEVEHTGSYLELDRPRRLSFTWRVPPHPESSRVDVEIENVEGGAQLTLTHAMAASSGGQEAKVEHGWRTMLDKMASVLHA
jgi:uncharacterized protein YndB with AHSA1/START domain